MLHIDIVWYRRSFFSCVPREMKMCLAHITSFICHSTEICIWRTVLYSCDPFHSLFFDSVLRAISRYFLFKRKIRVTITTEYKIDHRCMYYIWWTPRLMSSTNRLQYSTHFHCFLLYVCLQYLFTFLPRLRPLCSRRIPICVY